MKKIISGILCLMLIAGIVTANASARMPELRGRVTDDANVLEAAVVKAAEEVSKAAEKACGIKLYLVLVHFLDGEDAETYAKQLLEKWKLSDGTVLALGAAGEDACAVAMDDKAISLLGKNNLQNLMLTSGAVEAFKACEYDRAVALLLMDFGKLCDRQTGSDLQVEKLLPGGILEASPTKAASESKKSSGLNRIHFSSSAQKEEDDDDSSGLSFGEWLLIGILILIVFSQSNPVLKARRNRRGPFKSYGCGCSPIGWILSLVGITGIIDFLRSRRHR